MRGDTVASLQRERAALLRQIEGLRVESADLRERLETAETKYREQVQETYRQWTMNMEKNDRIRKLESLLRRHVDLQVGSLSKEEEDQLRQETFDALAAAPAGESESGRGGSSKYLRHIRRRSKEVEQWPKWKQGTPAHQSADEEQPDSGEDKALVALDEVPIPCSVGLPPASTVGKDCMLKTLLIALERRGMSTAPRDALHQRTRVPDWVVRSLRIIEQSEQKDNDYLPQSVASECLKGIRRHDEQEGA